MENTTHDVIIIGSGPAGLTAGIYMARGNRNTLVIGGRTWGGQLMLTTLVENFPGFADGIMGPDLMMAMRKQAENQGAKILDINFKNADFASNPFVITADDDKMYKAKSLIISTGANTKWLDVPGEKERIGRGVSSCAPCDAAFFRNKKVIVVGGGDSAMEEALVLTKFASHVYILHRKDSFRASKAMQDKVFSNEKITVIWSTEITEIQGENKVSSVKLNTKYQIPNNSLRGKVMGKDVDISMQELGAEIVANTKEKVEWNMPIDGVFVAIGHMPNSEVFKGIETDEKGFIKVFNHTKTNIEGVFVAGDVHDSEYKQAITAAGFGCMAALETERWLESLPKQ